MCIGKFLCLTLSTPDRYFSMQLLSKFLCAPREKHLQAATRVLRYLKFTPTHGIFFPGDNKLNLQG